MSREDRGLKFETSSSRSSRSSFLLKIEIFPEGVKWNLETYETHVEILKTAENFHVLSFKVIDAGVHTFRTPKETSLLVYGYNLNVFSSSILQFRHLINTYATILKFA